MASTVKTKMRLQHLSGAAGDVYNASAVTSTPVSFANAAHSLEDLGDMLKEYGNVLARIHGKSDFTLQTRGLIEHDAGTVAIKGSDTDAQKVQITQHDGTDGGGLDFTMESTGTAAGAFAHLKNVRGNTDGSNGGGALLLQATAGGMGLKFADGKSLHAEGGDYLFVSNENKADALKFYAKSGAAQTIALLADASTAVNAISLQADAGGVDVDAAQGKDVDIKGGQVKLSSKADADNTGIASAIELLTPAGTGGGAADTIVVTNTQGTTEGAIEIGATVGGVDIDAAAAKDVNIAGGQVALVSKDNAAGAISMLTNIGSTETITVTNTQGEAAGAIEIGAAAGGLTLDAAAAKIAAVAGGQVKVSNKTDQADAILLETNVGTSESIKIDNKKGEGATSIDIGSFAGGVLVAGGKANTDAIVFDASAGAANSRIVSKVAGVEVLRVADKSLRLTQDSADIELGSDQSLKVVHDSGAVAGYHQVSSTERLHLSGAANVSLSGALVQISGSSGLGIVGGGIGETVGSSFLFDGYNDTSGALLFSDLGSATQYKSNFTNKTVLAAINDVFSRVTSGVEPTLMQKTIASASITQGQNVGIYPGDGTDTSGGGTPAFFTNGPMSEIKPQKIDVFVNGQMMMSGSSADRGNGLVDYYVSAPGVLQFAFDLVANDVVKVIDRT